MTSSSTRPMLRRAAKARRHRTNPSKLGSSVAYGFLGGCRRSGSLLPRRCLSSLAMAGAADIFTKQYILTAGPTPLPPSVSQVMAEPILYHRAPAFVEIYASVLKRLPRIFQTRNVVLCFAATGTAAMESAVANLVVAGEPAVVASCGKFGERWAELCDAYGANTCHLEFEWGTKVDPERLDRELGELDRPARAVYVTQSETSTGVVNDVRALNEVARAHDSVLCVDAVSGLGAVELPQDEWGIDVVVAGSQKSLMCPPGLAFASVSDRAMALAAENPRGRYYLDWQRTAAGQTEEPPNSAFTPAVTLFRALDVALDLIFEEGLESVYARHALPAGASMRLDWSASAPTTRGRTWSRWPACPTTSTVPRCPSSCAMPTGSPSPAARVT